MFKFDYALLPYGKNGTHPDFNRMGWRVEVLFSKNAEFIKDQRVLDLACNNGRLSYPCLALGAKTVTAVEGRPELIEEGKRFLSELEERDGQSYLDRINFVESDLFDFLASAEPNQFDTVVCCGFLYHTTRQVDFFMEMKRLAPKTLIIDTSITRNYMGLGKRTFARKPPALFLFLDDPTATSDTIEEHGIVFFPTASFLEKMFDLAGYSWSKLDYHGVVSDWSGLSKDYKKRGRLSYIAHRKTKG